MARAALATIDLDAIRHNYRYAKRLAPTSRAVAVVKADAYGHGAVTVASTLAGEADAFGVACIEEALELREAGINSRILLLEGFFSSDEIDAIDRHGLSTAVHEPGQVEALLAARVRRPFSVWLKFDSGMHRLGMTAEELRTAHARLATAPQVAELVLMTHFARADEPECDYTRCQIQRFHEATAGLRGLRSLANSAAVMAWPETHGDWIRPGVMLYGITPFSDSVATADELRPAMVLTSAIIAVRHLEAGEPVGYGGRFRCDRPMRVGVVAAGYGDGYPRTVANGTPVAVKGRRTRVVGRVSMDMLTVDLTGMEDIRIGDPVELWGSQVRVHEVAAACDTIGYEVVTRRPPRVPRTYIGVSGHDG